MIFTLLNLSVLIAAVIAAIDSARQMRASVGEWFIALAIGAVVGGLFAFSLRIAAEFADTQFSRIASAVVRNLCISSLYLIAIFWAVVSMEVSRALTAVLLRLLTRA